MGISRAFLAACAGFVIGCGSAAVEKPHVDPALKSQDVATVAASSSSGSRPTATKEPLKPDFVLRYEDFEKEMKENKDAAKKVYKGKVLEIAGVLDLGASPFEDARSTCLFFASERIGLHFYTKNPLDPSSVSQEQTVTVRGIYDESFDCLKEAAIVESGPNKSLQVTAEGLAAAYTKDVDNASKQYDFQVIELTGELMQFKVDPSLFDGHLMEIKGDGKTKCKARFIASRFVEPMKEKCRVGDRITLLGKNHGAPDGKELLIIAMAPIEMKK